MKSQLLKLSGIKSEQEFYKKFPSEQAFFKAFPNARKMVKDNYVPIPGAKKYAEDGVELFEARNGYGGPGSPYINNGLMYGSNPNYVTQEDTEALGGAFGGPLKMIGGVVTNTNGKIPGVSKNAMKEIQGSLSGIFNNPGANPAVAGAVGAAKVPNAFSEAAPYIDSAVDIATGIGDIFKQKKQVGVAHQNRDLAKLFNQASMLESEVLPREYVRPEQFNPEELYPTYGVGSNAYNAKDGGEIDLPKAENGFEDFMNNGGINMLNGVQGLFGEGRNKGGLNPGASIGKGLGSAAGMALGGPIGAALGGFAGKAIGSLFNPNGNRIQRFNNESDNYNNSSDANAFGYQNRQRFGSYMEEGGLINYDQQNQQTLSDEIVPYKGKLETISYNPYLPEGGETVKTIGPSHEEDGMPLEFHDGQPTGEPTVEAEGGETITKFVNPETGKVNPLIGGNLYIPKSVLQTLDPSSKGAKFKHRLISLSKIERKQNKAVEKNTLDASDLNPKNGIDAITLKTLDLNNDIANKILESIAKEKQTLAEVQTSMNELNEAGYNVGKTKKEKPLVPIAEDGMEIPSAEDGRWDFYKGFDAKQIDPVLMSLTQLVKAEGFKVKTVEGGAFAKRNTLSGNAGRHGMGQALDAMFEGMGKETYKKLLANKNISSFLIQNGLTMIDEYDPAVAKKTGASGGHIHFGYDKMTDVSDKFRKDVIVAHPEFKKYVGKNLKNPSQTKRFPGGNVGDSYGVNPVKPILAPQDFNSEFAEKINTDGLVKKQAPYVNPGVQSIVNPNKQEAVEETEPKKFPWMGAANSLIDYFRPSDVEDLDPNQLIGERFALSNNQLDPVYAQKYNPQLLTPYDISLQDQLNEVSAQTNTAMRQAQGDPSALAMISGQADMMKSKILGEEFRMNQGKRDQVTSSNIATLNDAQLKNLAILGQQQERQSVARSNTKEVTQDALSSMSSKYAQNNLENKTLATYENLYNYRYDDDMKIKNRNPLADMQQMMANAIGKDYEGQRLAEKALKDKAAAEKKADKATSKLTARNGALVQAFKNL